MNFLIEAIAELLLEIFIGSKDARVDTKKTKNKKGDK